MSDQRLSGTGDANASWGASVQAEYERDLADEEGESHDTEHVSRGSVASGSEHPPYQQALGTATVSEVGTPNLKRAEVRRESPDQHSDRSFASCPALRPDHMPEIAESTATRIQRPTSLPNWDMNDQELVPDYSQLPFVSQGEQVTASHAGGYNNTGGAGVVTAGLPSGEHAGMGSASVAHAPHAVSFPQRDFTGTGREHGSVPQASHPQPAWDIRALDSGLERMRAEVLGEVTALFQSVMQQNLLPALEQVRVAQATVMSRLDRLEEPRVDDVPMQDLSLADGSAKPPVCENSMAGPAGGSVIPVAASEIRSSGEDRIPAKPQYPPEHGSFPARGPGRNVGGTGGTTRVGGILHAWQVTPEGDLELVPLEGESGVRPNVRVGEDEGSSKAPRSQNQVREKGLTTAEALEQARILP